MFKYIKTILLLTFLLATGATGIELYKWFKYDGITTVGQNSEITITAEDIRRIVELNGASVRVTVRTDTSYIASSHLFGIELELLKKTELNRLSEVRSFLIKAGCTDIDLKGTTVIVSKPKITSQEHLAEEYKEEERTGAWNPVTLQKIEISARNRATVRAMYNGLLDEAKYSVEAALYGFLPPNYTIEWK